MKVKTNAGIKDVPLTDVTAENYIVPKGEERFWHVIQERVTYNQNTGKRLSRPVLQKYDTKVYPTTAKYLTDAGYTLTVLHNPLAHKAQGKVENSIDIEAKRKEAQLIAKMKEELREELRKELKEELKGEKNKTSRKK